jgi:heme-degrading monooxygenase HmoA
VLVVTRFRVPAADEDTFRADVREVLDLLAARPGFRTGRVGRAADDPSRWALVTEWDGAGAYRRALGAYEVKVAGAPVFARAEDEPGAFEVVEARPGAGRGDGA